MSWTVPDNKKIQRKSPSPTTVIEPISINNKKTIDNKKKAKKKKINIKEIQLITDGLSFSDKMKLMKKNPEYREKIYKLAIEFVMNFVKIYLCVMIYNYYTMRYNQVYLHIICKNETLYNQDKLLEFISDFTVNQTNDLVDEYNINVLNTIQNEIMNELYDNDINNVINNEINMNDYIKNKLKPLHSIIVERNKTLSMINENRVNCKDNPKYNERLKTKLRNPKSMKMLIGIIYNMVYN